MRVFRGLLLLSLGAGAALAVGALLRQDETPVPRAPVPPVADRQPQGPGDPPVVWLSGEVHAIGPSHLVVRSGRGPEIRLQRLGEGATTFLRLRGDRWRRVRPAAVERMGRGRAACVESVLDRRTFLALRVFLDARCGPAGPAGR